MKIIEKLSVVKNNLKWTKIKYFFNMIVAIFIYPFYRMLYKKSHTILLYSSHEAKDYIIDNARVLFEYAGSMTECHNYFVVKNAKKIQQQYPNYNFVESGSIKNYCLYFMADGYLFGHGPGDIAPLIHRIKFDKEKSIFLGHGVDGFKRHLKGKTILEQKEKAETFISVSEFEKNIKVEDWKIPSEDVFITGYPRFDALPIYNSSEEKVVKNILYAPTWRVGDYYAEHFEDSQYYHEIINFVTNKELHEFLEKNDIVLHIYLHFYFQRYFEYFESISIDRVQFLDPADSLQHYLVSDDILITDYSSTSWDFYYMNKPVIFFMFDRDEYVQTKGSYIDLYTESIGRITTNIDSLLSQLKVTTFNYHDEVEHFMQKKNRYFKYIDQENCSRVMEVVNERLKK